MHIYLRRTIEGEYDSQTITNILQANQQHLELLRLEFSSDEPFYPDRFFLPPNLKFLCVWHIDDYELYEWSGWEGWISEQAVDQCPKLCGLEFSGELTRWAIDTISRFEKFVAYLTI